MRASTQKTSNRAGAGNVPRLCRWPKTLDDWLVKKATGGGFRSPQEYVNHLIRQAKEADETARAA